MLANRKEKEKHKG